MSPNRNCVIRIVTEAVTDYVTNFFSRHAMMSELMQASQFHEGNFHGQPSQGCRQWETGNNGISQFVLSTESEWGPCICPTKDEQRSTKLGKLPSSLVR